MVLSPGMATSSPFEGHYRTRNSFKWVTIEALRFATIESEEDDDRVP